MSTDSNNSKLCDIQHVDFRNLDDWKTFDEVEQLFPNFKKNTLLWLMRQKNRNGLDKIVKKVGRSNYVHVPGFSVWLSNR